MAEKWHIGRDGLARVCKAVVMECPNGGAMTGHYKSPEEAMKVADAMNKLLEEGVDFDNSYEFLVTDTKNGVAYPKGESERRIARLRTLQLAVRELERASDFFRQNIAEEIPDEYKDERFDVGEFTAKKTPGNLINDFDRHAYAESEDYNPVYRETKPVSESIKMQRGEGKGRKYGDITDDISERLSSSNKGFDGVSISKVKLTYNNEDGKITMSETSKMRVNTVAKLKETVASMNNTINEEKEKLLNEMKSRGINKINLFSQEIVYQPETTRTEDVVSRIRKEDPELYNKYAKKKPRRGYVTLTRKKK